MGNTTGAKVLGLALWEEVDLRQNYFTLTVPGNGTAVHVKCSRRRANHCPSVTVVFFSFIEKCHIMFSAFSRDYSY